MNLIGLKSIVLGLLLLAALPPIGAGRAQDADSRIRAFLDEHQGHWRDLNVPAADGQILYDLIVAHGYKRALEIGTSTGHSGTWIAWALSKTGGRLITVEIDAERRDQALRNFQASGLAGLIDSRLGDAHVLVPQLDGPFDFVFSDADKDWYIEYFKAVAPKLSSGGCIAAHNVSEGGRGWTREYLDFVRAQPGFTTTVDPRGSASLAVSFKK